MPPNPTGCRLLVLVLAACGAAADERDAPPACINATTCSTAGSSVECCPTAGEACCAPAIAKSSGHCERLGRDHGFCCLPAGETGCGGNNGHCCWEDGFDPDVGTCEDDKCCKLESYPCLDTVECCSGMACVDGVCAPE